VDRTLIETGIFPGSAPQPSSTLASSATRSEAHTPGASKRSVLENVRNLRLVDGSWRRSDSAPSSMRCSAERIRIRL